MPRPIKAALTITVALVCALTALSTVGAAAPNGPPGRSGSHAPLYYLALGDSLSVGWQPSPTGSHRTNEGYVDDVYNYYRATIPNLQLVNLGCQGDSTSAMIWGANPPFGNPSQCAYEDGSQLNQAVDFLHAHRKFIALVTIDIGANNVDFCAPGGVVDQACALAGISQAGQDMPVILNALRSAAAPGTPIVGMNYYDPFLALWFVDPAAAQQSLFLMQPLNGTLQTAYDAAGMAWADVQAQFDTLNFSGGPPPVDVQRICAWTWACSPYHDIHANALGYLQIAFAYEDVIGIL